MIFEPKNLLSTSQRLNNIVIPCPDSRCSFDRLLSVKQKKGSRRFFWLNGLDPKNWSPGRLVQRIGAHRRFDDGHDTRQEEAQRWRDSKSSETSLARSGSNGNSGKFGLGTRHPGASADCQSTDFGEQRKQ